MPEETNVPRLQDQIDNVDQSLSRIPLIVFISFFIAGFALAIGAVLENQSLLIVSLAVFVTCMSFSMIQARNARDEYRKLIDRINKI
ncbi:MAG: hypothetical protein NWE95_09465 [Candidatus Bathyarchaeota archaeon]|jgi:hypothetical protein|nr:hypothetical protein [Candidatus Bathyarchaeota archaeon]